MLEGNLTKLILQSYGSMMIGLSPSFSWFIDQDEVCIGPSHKVEMGPVFQRPFRVVAIFVAARSAHSRQMALGGCPGGTALRFIYKLELTICTYLDTSVEEIGIEAPFVC